MTDFQKACEKFTDAMEEAVRWKERYSGSTAARLSAAIEDVKVAVFDMQMALYKRKMEVVGDLSKKARP